MRVRSRIRPAAARERRKGTALPVETSVERKPYDTTNGLRTSGNASGSRGFYDSPEWRTRSREHLRLSPDCVSCGDLAVVCDHIVPTRPDQREGVLRGPIQSMCRRSHFSKSSVEQGERGDKPAVRHQRVRIDPSTGLPMPGEPHWWADAQRKVFSPMPGTLGIDPPAHHRPSMRLYGGAIRYEVPDLTAECEGWAGDRY